ncbi:hypothetical protein BDV96DRAFT_607363 [Lophiotrema nucula]|uniref:Uncharacterized protein n=1 Tax=Lophiotrema nucula TaxID=690887 RepID=A0A6A5YHD0_9PLEO|nr:hypothetical protein BDV96DRAFT_607363 [Lophiotrema nucula]
MPVTTRANSRRRLQTKKSLLVRLPYNGFTQPSQITNLVHEPTSSNRKDFWPCQKCSCQEGFFEDLVDNCTTCGHSMDDHDLDPRNPWRPNCDYLCPRDTLVMSVLEHTLNYGVMVIRATPMVGKTALLSLLGNHIVYNVPDLEPVYLSWVKTESRNFLTWDMFLQKAEREWQQRNHELRPKNPAARPIYLIDEAQGSYEEEEFWLMLKNSHNTRQSPLFVLVCVYGATGVNSKRDPKIESQAQRMHALHRVELRPSTSSTLCMLFRKDEVASIVEKFATLHSYGLGEGVVDYLYTATDGHPGMVGLLLSHIKNLTKSTITEMPRELTPALFHNLLVMREDSFVEWLSKWGRGTWSPFCEANVEDALQHPMYSHLTIWDIKKALRKVAAEAQGLTCRHKAFDAFAFCHRWGLLHTEQPITGTGTKFTFASPLHRRVAYRRLFTGREPDASNKNLSLQQICTNAIARMSPGALQPRTYSQSKNSWGIPEAAFQVEFYCCLSHELRYLPILSEYSHTTDGRVDFYVSDKRWGIEIIQSGTNAELSEHIARFTNGGKYQQWQIMDDYIILNFCPRSQLPRIKIQDEQMRSHFFHVVYDPTKTSVEIYTHNKELHKTWSLSEGRQRVINDDLIDLEANSDSGRMSTPDERMSKEAAMSAEIEELRREVAQEREAKLKEKRKREQLEVQLHDQYEAGKELDGSAQEGRKRRKTIAKRARGL